MEVSLIMLIICIYVLNSYAECPLSCECKWKSGKESVVCLNGNFSGIPKSLDTSTQLLDLTGNPIEYIGKDAFLNVSLLNLQKIYIAKCRLKTMDKFSFRKLINLVELDLSYNIIQMIPSHIFESIGELRELKLNGNPIHKILNNAFQYVPRLVRLELSDCKIGIVEPKAFSKLENSLEWLKLDRNKIVNVKSTTFTMLDSLHGLELTDNPWNCSCGIRPLRDWMLKKNLPYSVPPVCRYPVRLLGKPWDRLDLDEFACVPKIAAYASSRTGEEGSNVTMSCKFNGTPEPIVRWLWKNNIIPNITNLANNKKVYLLQVSGHFSNITIQTAELQDAGSYFCSAENKAGKVEANVTLSVRKKPREKIVPAKIVIAGVIVGVLFLLATSLLIFCVCNVRKRHTNHQCSQNVRKTDSYEKIEMNHKITSNNHNNINAYGNSLHLEQKIEISAVKQVPYTNKTPRNGRYRGVPSKDEVEDNASMEILTTPVASSWKTEDEDMSDSSRRRLSPDLHIPRLNTYKEDGLRGMEDKPGNYLKETSITSHVMHKQVMGVNGGTLYTSSPPDKKYPDLLELSPGGRSSYTLPRKRMIEQKRSRHHSDSQSPLLPDSRYGSDSSESTCSINRRLSSDSYTNYYNISGHANKSSTSSLNINSPQSTRNPSPPASPNKTPSSATPLLNVLDNYRSSPGDTAYDYHTSQLERFLEEYRNLQEQLYKMKETCENIHDEPSTMSKLVDPIFNATNSLRDDITKDLRVENSTISRLIEPFGVDSYQANRLLNESDNLLLNNANMNSSISIIEGNNNPRSILKNKSPTMDNKIDSDSAYWINRHQIFNRLPGNTSPNQDYYHS